MIDRELPWSTVNDHGRPSMTTVDREIPRSTVNDHGRPSTTMVDHELPWSTVIDNGRPSMTMVDRELPWSTVNDHGRPPITMVDHEDHIGNKCAIVCFNVSILGKYYIDMYYNVLPNKLTHSLTDRELPWSTINDHGRRPWSYDHGRPCFVKWHTMVTDHGH